MNQLAYKIPVSALLLSVAVTSCSQLTTRKQPDGSIPSEQSSEATAIQRGVVVKSAHQLLGSPYLYGGTTPNGFDCSGLTRHAYLASGITIPRTTAQQRDHSQTVRSYSQLKLGDLIFFKTGGKTHHVGIFTGNGEFIHASTSRKQVVKSKLNIPYWRKHFVKFGTYISSN